VALKASATTRMVRAPIIEYAERLAANGVVTQRSAA
jgi:hypothetical protein